MNRRGSAPLIVIGIILLVIIAGAIGYFVWKKSAESYQTSVPSVQRTSTPVTSSANVSSSPATTPSSGPWNLYVFQNMGFEVAVPPTFIPHESTDPSVHRVTFSDAPGESDANIPLSLVSTELSQGESLLDIAKNSDAESSSISSVPNGSASYVKWFSEGEGDGTWNYAIAISNDQAIIASVPSSSAITNEDFSSILYSLRPLPPPSLLNISSWKQINVSSTGLTFSMPDFGVPYNISVGTSTDRTLVTVELEGTSSAEFIFSIYNNTTNLNLLDWFEQNVDDEGALLTHGGYAWQALSDDEGLYTFISSAPLSYIPNFDGYGPGILQEAFIQSDTNDKIIGISGSPNEFQNYGFTTQNAGIQLQLSILSTAHF